MRADPLDSTARETFIRIACDAVLVCLDELELDR
jgi:hypothetical protein